MISEELLMGLAETCDGEDMQDPDTGELYRVVAHVDLGRSRWHQKKMVVFTTGRSQTLWGVEYSIGLTEGQESEFRAQTPFRVCAEEVRTVRYGRVR